MERKSSIHKANLVESHGKCDNSAKIVSNQFISLWALCIALQSSFVCCYQDRTWITLYVVYYMYLITVIWQIALIRICWFSEIVLLGCFMVEVYAWLCVLQARQLLSNQFFQLTFCHPYGIIIKIWICGSRLLERWHWWTFSQVVKAARPKSYWCIIFDEN